eukprot:CAMPEP_0113418240 /NCGR_PEP_ID=MMETSP0013_2-20120614/26101_1 /TAXON_ID=2843 ORGANISM="Skeletonema costatum, Strain 1716" /NCGR_SAMPLE_ID=MMETSP0013_2 /ASSEMBLY_ACC=CAM_ASM_000158 /LENGTH=934 /DNA_ID=CAMNT_0000305463 /DNA_START=26 /DNA_END=2830 /DNA_ORIENTATION=+ /assembly_acc=CAM_ASM_000158
MAALLPTILSDDEAEFSTTKSNSDGKKKRSKKTKAPPEPKLKINDSDDEGNSSNDEMDSDFEFGGILGEDGTTFDSLSILQNGSTDNSWSYKSALSLLSKNDSAGLGGAVERTNVASIIAAARSNLKRGKVESKDEGEDASGSSSSDDDEEESGSDKTGSDSDDSDSDSSDDEVDDVHTASHAMESDVLKVRERPQSKKKKKNKPEAPIERNEQSSNSDGSDDGESSSDDDGSRSGDESADEDVKEDEDEKVEAAKAAAFFDSSHVTAETSETIDSFSQLGLSRPLLRGVASMGFVTPTLIQASVLPVALAGRDVCASAVTGSGKTAAFLLPVMERILQRGGGRTTFGGANAKKKLSSLAATRALILTPTRELAAQCVSMMTAMAKFTDLRAALIVGGAKNVMSQATELRSRPDVVVATPGRLLDHITNSQGVDFDDLEFLILDEADRLLDLGFQEEVHELVKACPAERQTMLFSATMSTKVDDLISLSMKRPVRIQATDKTKKNGGESSSNNGVEVAPRLEQEFVRIRAGNEGVNREGMLLALLTRTFKSRTIVFFDTKVVAHRLMIVCGLCGIKCAELHGNLTQVQRLEALEAFREGSVDVLLCTDLAARGLDIPGVEAVINFEMPSQVETYVHRIGRTARAGRGGKSCTLIGEGRRFLMKEVIKDAEEKTRKAKSKNKQESTGMIRSRTIPSAVIAHFVAKINSLAQHVREVQDAEAVAKMDRIAEMEAMRVQNIIEHKNEIKARPQKEWFATPKQKLSTKAATAERKKEMEERAGTGKHRMTRKKRRAQEVREAMREAQEEARQEMEESGKKSKKAFTDAAMKGSAKDAKRKEAQREKELQSRSLYDEDMQRERKKQQKKRKAASSNSDALGDGGLFSEEKVSYAKKAKNSEADQPTKSAYTFHEYDPNKKKAKKKSHHGFKSKSKFRRK